MKNKMNGFKIFISVIFSFVAISAKAAPVDSEQFDKLQKEINALKTQMQELEYKDSSSSIKWSGVLINRFDYLDNKYNLSGSSSNEHDGSSAIRSFSTFVSFNAEAPVTEKVTFYGAIGMSKYWNQDGREEGSADFVKSQASSYRLEGDSAHVDKAFFTYKFDMPATISVGRMPTNNGPPLEEMDGLSRQGTYPRFAYNAIFDGIAATYDYKNFLPSNHSLVMRLFFTPFVQVNHFDRTKNFKDPVTGDTTPGYYQQVALLTEYTYGKSKVADEIRVDWMTYEFSNAYNFGYAFDSSNGSGVNGGDASGQMKWLNGRANMLYLGLTGLAGLPLNLNLSWLNYYGEWVGSPLHPYSSNAYNYDINYTFHKFGHQVLGAEYIRTDAPFWLNNNTILDSIYFHSMPNTSGIHIYTSRPLGHNLTARVGYYHTNTNSDPTWFVTSSEKTSYYGQIRLDF